MSASKLVNRDEFVMWYEEGKKYSWIIEEYKRKYGVDVGLGTISNWRHQLSLKKREVIDPNLIPWAVRREHRHGHVLQMLRTEGRRRAGEPIPADRLRKLEGFLKNLATQDAVVHYEPDTDQGWFLVQRRPEVDTDIIRAPAGATRTNVPRE